MCRLTSVHLSQNAPTVPDRGGDFSDDPLLPVEAYENGNEKDIQAMTHAMVHMVLSSSKHHEFEYFTLDIKMRNVGELLVLESEG